MGLSNSKKISTHASFIAGVKSRGQKTFWLQNTLPKLKILKNFWWNRFALVSRIIKKVTFAINNQIILPIHILKHWPSRFLKAWNPWNKWYILFGMMVMIVVLVDLVVGIITIFFFANHVGVINQKFYKLQLGLL